MSGAGHSGSVAGKAPPVTGCPGVGMRSHSGVAARAFEVLATEGINIHMVSTSEIKVSVVVQERYGELALRALHAGFGLADEPASATATAS